MRTQESPGREQLQWWLTASVENRSRGRVRRELWTQNYFCLWVRQKCALRSQCVCSTERQLKGDKYCLHLRMSKAVENFYENLLEANRIAWKQDLNRLIEMLLRMRVCSFLKVCMCVCVYMFIHIYIYIKRWGGGEGGRRRRREWGDERETSVSCFSSYQGSNPQPRHVAWPGDLSLCGMPPNPLSHRDQGQFAAFLCIWNWGNRKVGESKVGNGLQGS